MLRLYFKKLPVTLAFLALYFLVFLTVISFVWVLFTSVLQAFLDIKMHLDIQYSIVLIIGLILELLGVYFLRIENIKYKEVFQEKNTKRTYVFRKDFVSTFISADNLMHTCAYLTFTMPFTVLIGISAETPLWALILGSVIALITNGLFFAVINTLHWCIVHKRWLKQK